MKTKKSLGQHFLKSEKALRQIIDAGNLKTSDIVLEIGPGQGVLTECLLEKVGQVIAVEKDSSLVAYLKERFQKEITQGKLILIDGDILKIFDPLSLIPSQVSKIKDQRYKLVANIPYNITGEIFRKFLQKEKKQPECIVLLVQKEVAERIVGRSPSAKLGVKKESVLSISIKVYGSPKYIDTVRKGSFAPVPKVDSAILLIENISRDRFANNNISEEDFFKILKAGFAHKRKLLSNNLKHLGVGPLSDCNIQEKARAENLKLENWICLAKHFTT